MPSAQSIPRISNYEVASCPRCGQMHRFSLKLMVKAEPQERVVLFGGASRESEVLFICPDTNQKFTQSVPNPSDGEIVGVASEEDLAMAAVGERAPSASDNELAEWIKNSRQTALDFCKTMLTTSASAIPVYFAVLKYIGFERIDSGVLSRLTILPPILYLIAALLYSLAMRPRFGAVLREDFAAFRTRRLEQINRFMTAGTLTFAGATGLAIVLFTYELSR